MRRLQLGLIHGIIGIISATTTQATRSTASPRGGSNEPPDDVVVCPAFHSQKNRMCYAIAVFSSLSIVVCLAVMAVLCT